MAPHTSKTGKLVLIVNKCDGVNLARLYMLSLGGVLGAMYKEKEKCSVRPRYFGRNGRGDIADAFYSKSQDATNLTGLFSS